MQTCLRNATLLHILSNRKRWETMIRCCRGKKQILKWTTCSKTQPRRHAPRISASHLVPRVVPTSILQHDPTQPDSNYYDRRWQVDLACDHQIELVDAVKIKMIWSKYNSCYWGKPLEIILHCYFQLHQFGLQQVDRLV